MAPLTFHAPLSAQVFLDVELFRVVFADQLGTAEALAVKRLQGPEGHVCACESGSVFVIALVV